MSGVVCECVLCVKCVRFRVCRYRCLLCVSVFVSCLLSVGGYVFGFSSRCVCVCACWVRVCGVCCVSLCAVRVCVCVGCMCICVWCVCVLDVCVCVCWVRVCVCACCFCCDCRHVCLWHLCGVCMMGVLFLLCDQSLRRLWLCLLCLLRGVCVLFALCL